MRRTLIAAAAAGLLTVAACGTADTDAPADNPDGEQAPADAGGGDEDTGDVPDEDVEEGSYVNVVKLTGIAWFDRMEAGVRAFADSSGIDATQTGPSTDSPEQQVASIQSLIAQRPTVMGVVPSDPGAMQAVITQAREAGIVVVTHEAPQIQDADADIEPFANDVYGETIMEDLAACMGGEGEYVQFVGKLTAETHMEWSDAALELQQSDYPDMTRVSDPVESDDNADTAYERTKQLLQSHPELVGFQGASSQDVPGIARAIEEAGLEDDTCVFGTGVPSETRQFLTSGAIDAIYLWDPALSGQAMLEAGRIIAEGGELTEGTDLGVEGYESLVQSPDSDLVFMGDAQLKITADTVDDYDF
ncbi:autoinducer 2 ABC transporter substrate-binding protein [Phytoactinopolyspora mesophila]|uniref:Substrate-binding domain-containing protein n=1 Tax=Phytoactinopolyspora mesophila TaxID=2650750 RepID=A0A7K3M6E9_9ACTN|nr:autoinducer 2 ABC transporter substrate-binding protein [Phytoactinopolyspora mesophila]NDL58846.1 substrate-binding domain-containing protein [Phytoactinopolyspora mesophila]